MRVILDTNVLLAALIAPGGTPDTLYQAWRAGRFELISSHAQLDEIRRASRYPKLKARLPAHRVGTLVNHLRETLLLVELQDLPDNLCVDDPDDAFLLRMALAGQADWLITGDHRAGLLKQGSVGRTRIATPAVLLDSL